MTEAKVEVVTEGGKEGKEVGSPLPLMRERNKMIEYMVVILAILVVAYILIKAIPPEDRNG